ncbi:MAG: hypothetical protein GVY15_00285 [Bacteroidetes bacterium]|jgi:hypothetical protein|nr:hypothetical protein [Bacteroidota bacterium]
MPRFFIPGLVLLLFALPVHAQCTDTFLSMDTVVLDQETQLLGSLTDATRLPDGRIAVATVDPGVYLFDAEGGFLQQLGSPGEGPFEYLNPALVRPADGGVAVWDAGNLRLLTFRSDGSPDAEWTGFRRAASNFVLRADTLYLHHGGASADPYVGVYLRDGQGEALARVGAAPERHAALSFIGGAAPMAPGPEGGVRYASPAALGVQAYDATGGERLAFRIADPTFDTSPVDAFPRREDIGNPMEAIQQATQSSHFHALHTTPNGMLALLKHGRVVYERTMQEALRDAQTAAQGGAVTSSLDMGGVVENTIRHHAHLLAPDGTPQGCQILQFRGGEDVLQMGLSGPTPRGFFFYTERMTAADVDYELTEYGLPEGDAP